MKQITSIIIFLSFSCIVFVGCEKAGDSSTIPHKPSSDGTLTMKLGGVSKEGIHNTAFYTESASFLMVTGILSANESVEFSVTDPSVKTFKLGTGDTDMNYVINRMVYYPQKATVEITSFTEAQVTGKFSGTFISPAGIKRVITDGAFSIKVSL
jgi:hypothetical protein